MQPIAHSCNQPRSDPGIPSHRRRGPALWGCLSLTKRAALVRPGGWPLSQGGRVARRTDQPPSLSLGGAWQEAGRLNKNAPTGLRGGGGSNTNPHNE